MNSTDSGAVLGTGTVAGLIAGSFFADRPWLLIIIPLTIVTSLILFLLWRRKRKKKQQNG